MLLMTRTILHIAIALVFVCSNVLFNPKYYSTLRTVQSNVLFIACYHFFDDFPQELWNLFHYRYIYSWLWRKSWRILLIMLNVVKLYTRLIDRYHFASQLEKSAKIKFCQTIIKFCQAIIKFCQTIIKFCQTFCYNFLPDN